MGAANCNQRACRTDLTVRGLTVERHGELHAWIACERPALNAARAAVEQFLATRGATGIAELVEIESGSKNDRPKLALALDACRRHKATSLIAKLDRLARNVAFIANLMDSAIDFVATDMPHASRLVLHVMAVFAEHEREMISQRTKAALAAAKARGVKLGLNGARIAAQHHREAVAYAGTIAGHVEAARAAGAKTLTAIAAYLNDHGVPSREGQLWYPSSVSRTVNRLREIERSMTRAATAEQRPDQ